MKKHPWLAVLGTLVVGALGSGLWELIKPGVSWMGSGVLALVSLGFDSVVNNIYAYAGRANVAVAWIKSGVTLFMGIAMYGLASYLIQRRNAGASPSRSLSERWGPLLVMLMAATTMIASVRHAYVASTRAYAEYLLRVSAPYYTTEQRLALDSRLALVRTKSDFDAITTEIVGMLKVQNVPVQERDDF